MNQPLIRALNAWADVADGARAQKARLVAHMRGHAQAPVKAAFMLWKFARVAGSRMQKLISRWLGQSTGRLFSRWRFHLLGEPQTQMQMHMHMHMHVHMHVHMHMHNAHAHAHAHILDMHTYWNTYTYL